MFRACLSFAASASIVFAASPALAHPDPDAFPAEARAFIQEALDRVGVVPGLSIAVVRGDEPILVQGFGVADAETGAPVDAHTRFYIASATKSFTALALALMAERGFIDLDAPLSDWIDDAPMDPALASGVTLRDLLSHRSGLDNDPLSFRAAYTGDLTSETARTLLSRTVSASDAPHGTFHYTNVGYNLATTLIAARYDQDWRALVEGAVLRPLGMTETTAYVSRARAEGIVASGHFGHLVGGPVVSPLQKTDATMQSAGGLMSSAHDMALWLEAQLNDGMVDGRRVFPQGLVEATHESLVPQDNAFGPYARTGYGLGWQVGSYGDDILIHHFGNFAGSRAHVSFMPDRDLGVAVMINEDVVAGGLADVIADFVYDYFAGVPDLESPYETQVAGLVDLVGRAQTGIAAEQARRAERSWTLTRPLPSYAGRYVSDAYGEIEVCEKDGGLWVGMGALSAVAEPFTQPDSIRVELVPFQGQVIGFPDPDHLVYAGETFTRR